MKRIYLYSSVLAVVILLALFLLAGCAKKTQEFTTEQLSAEKAAIEQVAQKFHKAIGDESWPDFKSLLTEDCMIYGTDITDVDQGFEQLEHHMKQAFELLEDSNIHDMKNETFVVGLKFASIMYDATWDANFAGQQVSMPVRIAIVLKKADTWQIAQCMFSLPTVGQSNEVLLEQMGKK